ncbi:Galactosylgalactosylxylosylprotein 3-beta-glucuronosyltransferase 1 [Orchesella cincta]|uniref:Galactosylgalactosylxylosylprotein 3-beta-glucuronosyltransferase n=1 Tax=Orchesella cincta TaxID=48709 RepID=A0A1D2N145_ORCCI|nr:Galactosylgalactosylxylosylprotein 3-beta-glucuronosyltransferase 1 [Orchesella cincta]
MTKNKKVVFAGATLLLMVWCTKGYWTSDGNGRERVRDRLSMAYNDDRGGAIPVNLSPEAQAAFEQRERIINALKLEISQLERGCPKKKLEKYSLLPKIYAITPTYKRPVQKAELTRLSHTLMLVPNLHWVIVEDAEKKSELVANLLARTGMPYTHLHAVTPATWKIKPKEAWYNKPRGVLQRNAALAWLRANVKPDEEGVVYFADDDNAYSLEVFDEMRYVKTVGVWPVGLVGGLMVERPKVNAEGKVVGWLTVWSPNRPFAIDMAGFAVNLKLFMSKPEGKFKNEVQKGYQESEFLRHFVTSLDEVEPRADNCTKVNVWHTRTENPPLREEIRLKKEAKPPSDLGIEV